MKLSPYLFRRVSFFIPDKWFVSLRYFLCYKKFPDILNGRSFDEKMLKYILYYKNDILSDLVDKLKVRDYVKTKGYGHTLNELYGSYDNFDDIDFDSLPNQFVLKATHGCEFNIIVKDKSTFNISAARKQFNRWMHMNFYYYARERVYKNINRKIICEKYLENSEYEELMDYKISCYHGSVKSIYVMYGRHTEDGWKMEAFDKDWNTLVYEKDTVFKSLGYKKIPKPECYDDMIKMAEDISSDFPFVRVDVYIIKNQVIFGELTFSPSGGLTIQCDCKANNDFGSWLNFENIHP